MSEAVPDATTVRVAVNLQLDVDVARWREKYGWPERADSAGANRIRGHILGGIMAGIDSSPSVADGTITITERGHR